MAISLPSAYGSLRTSHSCARGLLALEARASDVSLPDNLSSYWRAWAIMLLGAVGISLDIFFSQGDLFFLYPSDPWLGPTTDTVIDGIVVVNLAVAQRVGVLKIALVGTQKIHLLDRTDFCEFVKKEETVVLNDKRLAAGKHEFRFSLHLPANSAPSQQCSQGETRYSIVASLPDTGFLGNIVKAERKIAVHVSHAEERNGPAPSFSMVREIYHDRFGAMRVEVVSKYLLVAGYLRLHWYMPEVPAPVKVEAVIIELLETVGMVPFVQSGSKKALAPTAHRAAVAEEHHSTHQIWHSAHDVLYDKINTTLPMKDNDRMHYCTRQARLPNHSTISPTTSAHSATGIRVLHRFRVKIIYLEPNSGTSAGSSSTSRQMLEFVSGPAHITTCHARLEYTKLPTYEEAKTDSGKGKSKPTGTMARDCLCAQALRGGENTVELDYGVSRQEVLDAFNSSEQQRVWAFENIRVKTEERAAAEARSLRNDSASSSPATPSLSARSSSSATSVSGVNR